MDAPFYLGNKRAMVSIGPVSEKRHCSFKCPFCYVESEEFKKYEGWNIDRTIQWLDSESQLIDIIYISADTDSFAKPRTLSGLELLDKISYLKKDILFTTRYVFDSDELMLIKKINDRVNSYGKIMIGCVSVCQITHQYLEPSPIKSSEDRILQLNEFKKLGLIPILAMRPLLPQVQNSEYETIIKMSAPYTSYCLISPYFYDPNSSQISPPIEGKEIGNLFFNTKTSNNWQVVEPTEETLSIINKAAAENNITVFLSSTELYDCLKSH